MDDELEPGGADPHVVASIRSVLQDQGMKFEVDDRAATFVIDGHTMRRRVRWLPEAPTLRQLDRSPEQPRELVYLADRIRPSVGRWIRDAGGWYADALGNMHLREPGVLVDVSGRAPKLPRTVPEHAGGPSNLMSTGRAQVVFAVLTWPHLLTRSMREIGYAAGVSPAAVHKAFALLEVEQYLSPTRRLARRDELIDLWAAAYPLGLARATERARLQGEPSPAAWPDLGHRVYVSGEYATAELTGPDLVLYAHDLDPKAVITSRWQRPGPAEHANIIVRRTFWIDPDRRERGPGVELAPPLLVYGDLLASTDPRQREIARRMRGDL